MSTFRRFSILLLLLILICVLSGCGGGGDGDNPNPVTSSASSKLSEENAVEVASIILKSTARSSAAASSADASASSVSSSSGSSKISGSDLAKLAEETMKELLDARQGVNSDSTVERVIAQQTISCDGSGTFTFTFDDVNNDGTLGSGDIVVFDYSQCSFANNANTVYNGQLSWTISSLKLGTGDFRFTNFEITQSGETVGYDGLMRLSLTAEDKVLIEFDNLKFTQNGETNTFDGDIAITVQTQDNIIVDVTVAGNSLTLSDSNGTSTLSSYEFFTQLNNSTSPSTYIRRENGSITIDHQQFNGTIDFETLQDFEGELNNDPFVGQEKFTSQEDGSSVLITVDGDNVTIEIDEDGDGTSDKTINTTWEKLSS